MIYYFYYAGDVEFANAVETALDTKDYEAFMKLYKEESKRQHSRLPSHAWNAETDDCVSILEKDNFVKITEYEYEWG